MGKFTDWIICALIMFYPLAGTGATEFVKESKNIFAHPHDVELHPSGQWLFVADTNNHNIKVLDADTLEKVAVIGDGVLDSPHDVHFDASGRLLVADSGNNRVVIYRLNNLKADLELELSKNMRSPEGVTSSSDGHIYVASTGNHKILKFFQNNLVKEIGRHGEGKLEFVRPHDIELGSDGLLYVGDPGNRRIQVLTDTLTFHSVIISAEKQFNEPKYLALDNENFLYVADQQNNLLRIFNADRKEVGTIAAAGEKHLNFIEGVEVAGARIWISDTYNNRIVLFSWHH